MYKDVPSANRFDHNPSRRGTYSSKWDKHPAGVISMDVADLDFEIPEPVVAAMLKRLEHRVLGYNEIDPGIGIAISEHVYRRHRWRINPDWITLTGGAIPSIATLARILTPHNGQVAVPVPTFRSLRMVGEWISRSSAEVPFIRSSNRYDLDTDRLRDLCLARPTTIIVSNPNNPTGTCFSPSELREIAAIAAGTNAWVLSDELHSDLIWRSGLVHTPLCSLDSSPSSRLVTIFSPSKSFNLPGENCTAIVIPNQQIRSEFRKAIDGRLCKVSTLGYVAARAAYENSDQWLQPLNRYLENNFSIILSNSIPGFLPSQSDATYLAWINVYPLKSRYVVEALRTHALVALSPGDLYGDDHFIRMNYGCSQNTLREALTRIKNTYKDLRDAQ